MDLAPVQNVGGASLQSYVTKKKPQQYRSGRDQQHSRLEEWNTPQKVRKKNEGRAVGEGIKNEKSVIPLRDNRTGETSQCA